MPPDLFRLEGLNVLVTGASTGIGAAIAEALGVAGANVACHGNSQSPRSTCERIERAGQKALPVEGDLARPETPARLIDTVLQGFGSLDILVNNAGTIRRAPAADFTDADFTAVVDVNLTSVFRLCQLAGRHRLERQSGKIENLASLLSFQGGITVPAYAASKGGVAQLTTALANEWAARGVNVNSIAPGYIETNNTKALRADPVRSKQILDRIPAGRWGEPSDIAGAAVFLCAPASNYINGHVLVVDGGWMGR
jgi:2-deoxy-D-gluconate 3-dehydrogenase